MKPTPRQKLLIEEVQNQVAYWMNTNDLTSPTHYGDLEEEIKKLEDSAELSKADLIKFEDLLGDLLDFIKTKL